MLSTVDVVIVAGALLGFALVAGRLATTPVSSAMVFTAVGLVVGGDGFDVLEVVVGSSELRLLAEATLAFVLFSDASMLDTRRLVRERAMPLRLLGVALPLSIVVGTVVAVGVLPDLAVFEAVALAVLLAPTDAALGQPVIADARLPSVLRQGLNVESGLNDGVCVPLLFGALALAELEEAPSFRGEILVDLVEELLVATVLGVLAGLVVAVALRWSGRRGWLDPIWSQVAPPATVGLAYVITVDLGGSGFIAAFVAGLVFGRVLGPTAREMIELDEDIGRSLSAITFLFFGATLVGTSLAELDGRTVVYTLASLTVVRMVPVAISLVGSGAARPTAAFAGWFGPRGLATIVFALTVVEESALPGTDRIVTVATFTVLTSVVAHGLSAHALTDSYVGWIGRHRDRLTFETAEVDLRSQPQPRLGSSGDD
jgi:NhaP-type Na+/H+ or K+/H+ antiporter